MHLPRHLTLRVAACLSLAFVVSGCSSSDARARDALNAYQSATAVNDLVGARKALLKLVRVKDDVPDYWVELGKIQATMGSYDDAYYSFGRAYELDHTNVDVLRSVTELALRAGDLPSARNHAEELSVLSPGDPTPKLVTGWSAISESHFDQALDAANAMLVTSPVNSSATVLKARALVGLDRQQDAADLLTKEVQTQPDDVAASQLLVRIYERETDWAKVLPVALRLMQLTPADHDNGLLAVMAGFRSGNIAAARQASFRLLQPDVDSVFVSSVLDVWADYWPSPQRITDALALADKAAGLQQKLAYAAFLSRCGDPADAIRLSSGGAGMPVDAKNAEANAVLADAWSRQGNVGAAKNRLDAVLSFDPGNATALRSRAELELRTGHAAAAVIDAQKLVTVLPKSSRDRVLLSQSFVAAGNPSWGDRTLWSAFQDIPANERIFIALEATKKGNPEATRDLQEEFDRQRDSKLGQGMF